MSKQQLYTPEFKAEAVKLVLEQDHSAIVGSASVRHPRRDIGHLGCCCKPATVSVSVPSSRSTSNLLAEVTKLRKELA